MTETKSNIKSRIVSTEEFWDAMGHGSFHRLSLHKGKFKDDFIYTKNPPETVDGFLLKKTEETQELLSGKPNSISGIALTLSILTIFLCVVTLVIT